MIGPIADFVVDVGSDGRILSQGSLSSALARDTKLLKEVEEEQEELHKADQEIDSEKPEDAAAKQASGKLVVAEELEEGHVGLKASEWGVEIDDVDNSNLLSSVAVPGEHVTATVYFLAYLRIRTYDPSFYRKYTSEFCSYCYLWSSHLMFDRHGTSGTGRHNMSCIPLRTLRWLST